MPMTTLDPPKAMNLDASSGLAEQWKKWERAFRTYYEAAELSKKKGSTQVAILLHCAGEGARDRFDKFEFTNVGSDKEDNLDAVLNKFKALCEPRRSIIYDTHIFFQRRQLHGETFEAFLNALKTEADKCDFGDLKDRFICMQLIFGHNDALVRDKMLLDPKITLAKAIDICSDAEASKIRKRNMQPSSKVRSIGRVNFRLTGKSGVQKTAFQSNRQSMIDCRYCGKQHQSRQCPAYGKFCKKCGKKNHFANVCRSSSQKQIKELEADFTGNYSDPHEFFRIDSLSSTSSKPKLTEHMIVKDDDGVQFSIVLRWILVLKSIIYLKDFLIKCRCHSIHPTLH